MTNIGIWPGKSRDITTDDDVQSDIDIDADSPAAGLSASSEYLLKSHIKCFSHTLDLCASTDITKVIKNSLVLSGMHRQVFKKCNVLWKIVSRPRSAKIVQNEFGHTRNYALELFI
ncbi:hypothetical protein ABEB36_000788 [Hypothenemus hampei]|uniref:Uncharacterized protein n=1 Tax=Hypothenemus hampei TaxID=57062 RepID=A0ABD1FCE9_HYPHA